MKINTLGLLLSIVILVPLSCTEDDSGGGTGPGPIDDRPAGITYTLSGDSITLVIDSSYCMGNTLVQTLDTVSGTINLSGTSLTITLTSELGTGTVITNTRTYTRQGGSGSTLEGTWQVESDENVVAGMLPGPNEVGDWADDTLLFDRMIAAQGLQMTVDSVSMVYSFEGALAPVMLPVALEDTPEYARITIDTAADNNSVTLTGGITGEVVTITFGGFVSIRFSRSFIGSVRHS